MPPKGNVADDNGRIANSAYQPRTPDESWPAVPQEIEPAAGLDATQFQQPLPDFDASQLNYPDAESATTRWIDTDFAHTELPPSLLGRTAGWTSGAELGFKVKPREIESILALAEEGSEGDPVAQQRNEEPFVIDKKDFQHRRAALLLEETQPEFSQWMTSQFQTILDHTAFIPKGNFLWELIHPQDEDGCPTYRPDCKYAVKLFVEGKWRMVEVDDLVPCAEHGSKGQSSLSLLPRTGRHNTIWPALLTKAILKAFPVHCATSKFQMIPVITALTGWSQVNVPRLWENMVWGRKEGLFASIEIPTEPEALRNVREDERRRSSGSPPGSPKSSRGNRKASIPTLPLGKDGKKMDKTSKKLTEPLSSTARFAIVECAENPRQFRLMSMGLRPEGWMAEKAAYESSDRSDGSQEEEEEYEEEEEEDEEDEAEEDTEKEKTLEDEAGEEGQEGEEVEEVLPEWPENDFTMEDLLSGEVDNKIELFNKEREAAQGGFWVMADTLEKAVCNMSVWFPAADGFSHAFDSSWPMPREEPFVMAKSQMLLMRITDLPPPPPPPPVVESEEEALDGQSEMAGTEFTETDAHSSFVPPMELPDRPEISHETIIEWNPVWQNLSRRDNATNEGSGLVTVKGQSNVSDAGIVLTHLHTWQENPSKVSADAILLNGLSRIQMNLSAGDHLWHARPLSQAGGTLSVWGNKRHVKLAESHFGFAPVDPQRPPPVKDEDGKITEQLVPENFLRTDGEYVKFTAPYVSADAGYHLIARWKISLKEQALVQMWCEISDATVASDFRLRLVKLDESTVIHGNTESGQDEESSVKESHLPLHDLSAFNLAQGASEESPATFAMLLESSTAAAYAEGEVTIHWWLLPKSRPTKEPSTEDVAAPEDAEGTPAVEGEEGAEAAPAASEEAGSCEQEENFDTNNPGKFLSLNEELAVSNLHRWSAPISQTPLLRESKRTAMRERLFVENSTIATLRVGLEGLEGAHVNFQIIRELPPTDEMRLKAAKEAASIAARAAGEEYDAEAEIELGELEKQDINQYGGRNNYLSSLKTIVSVDGAGTVFVPHVVFQPNTNYIIQVDIDEHQSTCEWPLPEENEATWFLEAHASDTIEIGLDTTEADLEELVRKAWEGPDAGRTEKAKSLRETYLKKVAGEEVPEEPAADEEAEKPADFITEEQLASLRVEKHINPKMLEFVMDISATESFRQADGPWRVEKLPFDQGKEAIDSFYSFKHAELEESAAHLADMEQEKQDALERNTKRLADLRVSYHGTENWLQPMGSSLETRDAANQVLIDAKQARLDAERAAQEAAEAAEAEAA